MDGESIKKKSIVCFYCFLLSFAFLLICTKSSPLYPFNDWVDPNAFFTMGKGMMNGKVLYRDLFEQKGPLLYFIHGLAYLVSNATFLGVFVFEVIAFSVFLYFAHKIIILYADFKYSIAALPLIAAIVLNMSSFSHGDSAEEFCIPLLAVSLYCLLNYFKTEYPNPPNNNIILINGIIAGCVLWIKFSLLGFWFGFMASMFFCMAANKNYSRAVKSCFVFLFGMFIATIPWIVYFGVNNSIFDWLYSYFYVNIKFYPSSAKLADRPLLALLVFAKSAVCNPVFTVLSLTGLCIFIKYDKFIKSAFNRACLLFCAICLLFGVYGGGRWYIYYFLIFAPFIVFFFIALSDIANEKFKAAFSLKKSVEMAAAFSILALALTFFFNQNAYFLNVKKQDLVQYKFAGIINQTQNPTLLNYGYLDNGFYTVANIVPNIKYFENQNVPYSKFPVIMDEQNRYIKDRKIDYVVIKKESSNNIPHICSSIGMPYKDDKDVPYLYENYKLIATDTQVFENEKFEYLLFKLK